MIIIEKIHFILFLIMVILSTIIIYRRIIPCKYNIPNNNTKKKKKIKYIPIYVINKKKEEAKEEKKEKNNDDDNINIIGKNISSHNSKIVPSAWDDNLEDSFKFEY
jgi:hypothetical protein